MKEINLSQTILRMRREKGLTQNMLADYIGVSKASVSKWETGQSFPDITILPRLAAFFNITIDELIGYKPQMCKDDIRRLYIRLSADFCTKPFSEVINECCEIAREYYSCLPLLFQIGALMVNNCMQADTMEESLSVVKQAQELFIRIKSECEDGELSRLALNMEAFCALTLGNPQEVINLLEGTDNKVISTESLLASANQLLGKLNEARSVLQIGMYQHMAILFGDLNEYLGLCTDDRKQFDETYLRSLKLAELFHLKSLHPAIMVKFYICSAQGYIALGDRDKALDILEEYSRLVTSDIYPLKLKGDSFFNLIDRWFQDFELGTAMPRDERAVRQSMVDIIVSNPVFSCLNDNLRFQTIANKVKTLLE